VSSVRVSARLRMAEPGELPPGMVSGTTSLADLAERGKNMHRLTLPAHKRLRRKSEFDAAYASGRRFGNGFFAVTASSNDKYGARLGMAVAVRTAGTAVERNRIRRLVRESFRLHQAALPALDIVVSAKPKARGAAAAELRASLAALWKTISEHPIARSGS
jgi:ribonuclease P protein component